MSAKKSPRTKTKPTATTRKKKKSIRSDKSKRDQHRVPINLLVDYRASGTFLFDFCKDLGSGGVFIHTESPLPKGTDIELTFTLPDSNETLNTRGTVIWVQNQIKGRSDLTPGMGVQFCGFDVDKRRLLDDFVTRHHGSRFHATPQNDSQKQPA